MQLCVRNQGITGVEPQRASSADTFPAVYALHPADASTCRASFPGACLAVEPEGAPVRPPDRDVASTVRAVRESTRSRDGDRYRLASGATDSSHAKARRMAVASSRNGEYRGIFRRHLSRRLRAAPCRRLHLPRVFSRSLPGRLAGRRRRCVRRTGTSPPPFVRSGSPRDRAAGSVTAGSRSAPAAWVPPSKNADGPLPHPNPLPTLRFACIGHRAAAMDRVLTPADTGSAAPATKSTKAKTR
jgi:hypothetical protein